MLFHIPFMMMMNQSMFLSGSTFPKPKTRKCSIVRKHFLSSYHQLFHATNNFTFHTTKKEYQSSEEWEYHKERSVILPLLIFFIRWIYFLFKGIENYYAKSSKCNIIIQIKILPLTTFFFLYYCLHQIIRLVVGVFVVYNACKHPLLSLTENGFDGWFLLIVKILHCIIHTYPS